MRHTYQGACRTRVSGALTEAFCCPRRQLRHVCEDGQGERDDPAQEVAEGAG